MPRKHEKQWFVNEVLKIFVKSLKRKKQKSIAEICHFVNNCFQNKGKRTAKNGSPHKMKGTTKTAVPFSFK